MLPYRRYACTSLLPLAADYLDHDETSYEQAVTPNGQVVGYLTPGQQTIDERTLHRSTLWRFASFLGAQAIALQVGLQLFSRHDPSSTQHRFVGAVAPHKFRSRQRDEILRTARRLLHLIDQWDRTFRESFFPRFATRPQAP